MCTILKEDTVTLRTSHEAQQAEKVYHWALVQWHVANLQDELREIR